MTTDIKMCDDTGGMVMNKKVKGIFFFLIYTLDDQLINQGKRKQMKTR